MVISKKKTETKQNQTQTQNSNTAFQNTAQFGEYAPTDTQDIQAFRDFRPQADPGIAAQFANERNQLNSSFINPLGGRYNPRVEERIKQSEGRDISQRESQAFRQGAYDQNQQRSGQLGMLAGLTAPRLVQTGSQGTSNAQGTGTMQGQSSTVQGNNLFGDILGIAQAGAGMAML